MVLLNEWSTGRSGVDLLLLEETVTVAVIGGVLSGSLSTGEWCRRGCWWFSEVDLSIVLRLQDGCRLLAEIVVRSTVEVRNLWYIYEVLWGGCL